MAKRVIDIDPNDDSPIFHIHVKVTNKMMKDGEWFAEFTEPNGNKTWVNQPVEPQIGDEQVQYVIRGGFPEHLEFAALAEKGNFEEIERFIQKTAKKHNEWCDKSWDEIHEALDLMEKFEKVRTQSENN